MLLAGKRAAVATTTDKDTYVLFGATRPIETPYMVAVLDPELPGWIKDSLSTAVPACCRATRRSSAACPT